MAERDTYMDDDDEYENEDVGLNLDESGKWSAGLNVLLGLWLVVEPFLFDFLAEADVWTMWTLEGAPAANYWNDIIIGAAIAIVAGYNYYRASNEEPVSVGAASFVALLGLWMIVAPFVFEIIGPAGFWNDVIVGALVTLIASYSVYEARDVEATTVTRT